LNISFGYRPFDFIFHAGSAVDVKQDKEAGSEAEPSSRIRTESAEKSAIGETPIDHLWRDDVSTCDTKWRKRANRYDIQGVSESSYPGDTCYSFVAHVQQDVLDVSEDR